jgi:hypothetical protein
MYLVSYDYRNESTKPPPDQSPEVKMPRKPPLPKKRNTNKRQVKKKTKKKNRNTRMISGFSCVHKSKKPV